MRLYPNDCAPIPKLKRFPESWWFCKFRQKRIIHDNLAKLQFCDSSHLITSLDSFYHLNQLNSSIHSSEKYRGLGNGFPTLSEILTIVSTKLQMSQTNCLISLFYIKPQPLVSYHQYLIIVLYLFSTSNHNFSPMTDSRMLIVLYLFSTSNHNCQRRHLYLSSIVLYLFSTSNHNTFIAFNSDCMIVLYLFSTSNHNCGKCPECLRQLSYISFLHQTTTFEKYNNLDADCLISLFYIKPQRLFR